MTQITILFFCVGVELGVLIGFFVAIAALHKIDKEK